MAKRGLTLGPKVVKSIAGPVREAWWYENDDGADVVVEVVDRKGVYQGTATVTILWDAHVSKLRKRKP